MAASLPGSTQAENLANPSAGLAVLHSPFSGPKGSPFGGRTITAWTNGTPTYTPDPTNLSTGGLNTGIGFGSPPIFGANAIAPEFNDDYSPGIDYYPVGGKTAATTAILTCIGGGKSGPAADGIAPTTPLVAQPILMAGQGGSRDAGAGPVFTGFAIKTVTAAATIANGAEVEAGFVNRSGLSISSGQSVFGSSTAASPAVA